METAAEKRMASGNPVQVRPFTIDFDLWQTAVAEEFRGQTDQRQA
jgi:hypothetical protein